MIRPGMIVRTNHGEKLGRVASVGTEDFVIESGILFKHRFPARLDRVIETRGDEVLIRPIELPDSEREMADMVFGTAETPEELERKREEARLQDWLLHDEHPRHD